MAPGEHKGIFGKVFRFLDILLALAVAATFLEVLTEVFFRYILDTPLSWGGELSQTILVWITFIGASVLLYQGEHMVIDLLVKRIASPAGRKVLRFAGSAAVLLFLLFGTVAGWQVVTRTWEMRTTAMQIPAGILYLAFPAGCLLMVLVVLRDLAALVRRS